MALPKLIGFVLRHPMNRGRKLAAIGRLLRWQAGSRLLREPVAVPFVNDTRLLLARGMTGATGNWYCGLHEPAEMGFLLHLLRAGDLFLDIGANVGSYSVLAGGAAGADVISVEPIPETFRQLLDNLQLNVLPSAGAMQCGVSSTPGELHFTTDLGPMNRVVAAGPGASIGIPVRTVDALLNGRIPLLAKVDVEGHEDQALAGAEHTLRSPGLQAVIMETRSFDPLSGVTTAAEAATARLRDNGFSAHGYDPFERRLIPYRPDMDNTVFVRDRTFVEDRLASAPRFKTVAATI